MEIDRAPQSDSYLLSLFHRALSGVFQDYQILRAVRSFSNGIVDFEIIFANNFENLNHANKDLADYRLFYSLKKVLTSNSLGKWTNLHDKMLLPLTLDEVLVVPFDAHRHEPSPEQISMVLGFDGVIDIVGELIAQRLISQAIEKLVESHQPFAFGIINIDNYAVLKSTTTMNGGTTPGDIFFRALQERLGQEDIAIRMDENEFATILECAGEINEVFPRLWELSNLSTTPLNIGANEMTVEFSAGYVLVTDPFITAKEILDEATSMMYKSKSNGKNGYYLSDSHHSASDPSM